MAKTSRPEIPPLVLSSTTCEACAAPKKVGTAFCGDCIFILRKREPLPPFNYMEALYYLRDLESQERAHAIRPDRKRVSTQINIIKGEERAPNQLYISYWNNRWEGYVFVCGERVFEVQRRTREEIAEYATEGGWEVIEV